MRLRKVLVTLGVLAAVFLVALVILSRKGEIYNRFISLIHLEESAKKEKSLTHRRDFYKTALALIREKPLLGWGCGRKTPRSIKTGAFFSILALLVHGLVTNFFQQPFIFLLFLYIALINTEVRSETVP